MAKSTAKPTKGFIFNEDSLNEFLESRGSKVLEKHFDVNRKTIIKAKCVSPSCDKPMKEKQFQTLVQYENLGCKEHAGKIMAARNAETAKANENKPKIDYTFDTLRSLVQKHGMILDDHFDETTFIRFDTPISAKCKYCTNHFTKPFIDLVKYELVVCDDCVGIVHYFLCIEKDPNGNHNPDGTFKYYNRFSLKTLVERNELILRENYDDAKIGSFDLIKLKCKLCDETMIKTFRNLVVKKNFGCINCRDAFGNEKRERTCMKNFGKKHVMQVPEFKAKMIASQKADLEAGIPQGKRRLASQKKLGVDNPMQHGPIAEKQSQSMKKFKDYKYPSGTIIRVQGYEPFALNDLLNLENLDESDIIVSKGSVPVIKYQRPDKVKPSVYFVDIYIPSQNRCIEVKSTYTIKCDPEIIKLKQEAMVAAGYDYEIWVYNDKERRVQCDKYPGIKTEKQQIDEI